MDAYADKYTGSLDALAAAVSRHRGVYAEQAHGEPRWHLAVEATYQAMVTAFGLVAAEGRKVRRPDDGSHGL